MSNDRRPLLIIFLTIFIDLLGFGIVLPLLPRYAKALDAAPVVLGLLMSSFSAMQFLFAPLWGRLSDRLGRRPILMIGLFGSAFFYGLFGVASSLGSIPLLFVSRIGAGIAGATIATAQAYIADSTPPEHRTHGMAIIGAAFGIGFTFGPILGAFALWLDPGSADQLSPMPGYIASGLSALALILAAGSLPESLKRIDGGPSHAQRHWLRGKSLVATLRRPEVGLLIIVFFIATFAFAKFESTIALLSGHSFDLDDRHNFYLFAYIGLTLTLAQGFLVRRLSKRLPDRTLAIAGILALIAGMLGLVLAVSLESLLVLMLALPVLVSGFSLLTSSAQGMISRRSRADEQGEVLGVNQSGSALARILGPFIGIWMFGPGDTFLRTVSPYLSSVALLVISLALVVRVTHSDSVLSSSRSGS